MREWLRGGAPPCQGGGRGFESRLALLFFIPVMPGFFCVLIDFQYNCSIYDYGSWIYIIGSWLAK